MWSVGGAWRIGAIPRGLLVLAVLLLAAAGRAAEPPGLFSDELDTDAYDCRITLAPASRLSAAATVTLLLDWRGTNDCTRLTFTRAQCRIETIAGGRRVLAGTAKLAVRPGAPLALTVHRRGTLLGLRAGETLLFHGAVPRAVGALAGISADRGWTVTAASVQRLEPVSFADNFMRGKEESGGWITRSGDWRLASVWDDDPRGAAQRFANAIFAQNPFAWTGRAQPGANQYALCTTGDAAWEDYTVSAAVCPRDAASVGLAVNLATPARGLLVRWSSAADRGARGNALGLYALADGKLSLLKSVPGGCVPGQWARLSVVSSLGEVRVLVDGQERLALRTVTPWRGGVGLFVAGDGAATFDDVTVYGRALNTDLLYEEQQVSVSQRMKHDRAAAEWAPRGDWTAAGNGDVFHRQEFFGDHRLALVVTPTAGAGRLWLALNTDGARTTSGYRAVIEPNETGNARYAIYHNETALAATTGLTMPPDDRYAVRFWRERGMLRLEIDGQTIVQANIDAPAAGLRPAYHAEGCYRRVEDPIVLGRNVLDYTFADAPVDWVADGAWAPSIRWACAPQWSFFGGWSRGDAVLWHKQRFTGDQTFQAYLAPKMEYPRETHIYLEQHYRDLNITLCGDGVDPRVGYTAVCGAPDAAGRPTRRAVLLRNGVEVGGRDNVFTGWPYTNAGHQAWYEVELRKRGATVEVWVEGAPIIRYTDPEPLAGGVPAVWTTNNGIMLARARLLFANPPAPRATPQVMLDDPWYPEWFDIGTTYTLDFPNRCATSGAPVTLRVETRQAPTGATAPVARDGRLTFAPTAPGEHWYQVNAVAGDHRSPSFHLFAPVFTPEVGRDDRHALLLYRFDEGSGTVVHDRAAATPTADLTIPANGNATWLPGRGLSYHGGPALRAAAGEKLSAIAFDRKCTLELWLSTESLYPPPMQVWTGNILSWEGAANLPNFALAHHSYTLFHAPRGHRLAMEDARNFVIGPHFRTNLHHWVLTWDGTTTRCYRDGQLIAPRAAAWNEADWDLTAPLLLGNTATGAHGYLGTFYLVAIHDRPLPPEQVERHYRAGPAARGR